MSRHCDSDLYFEYLEEKAVLADRLSEIPDDLALAAKEPESTASTEIPTTGNVIPLIGDKKSDRDSPRQK